MGCPVLTPHPKLTQILEFQSASFVPSVHRGGKPKMGFEHLEAGIDSERLAED